MKITAITVQVRNPDRVNISIDGSYRLSLTVAQLSEQRLHVGDEVDDAALHELERASTFGKLYQRTLEYALMRPRSVREVKDYLYRKTQSKPVRNRTTGAVTLREGVDSQVADHVLDMLREKGYVSDEKFADFWVRNRFVRKGISVRKLRAELFAKGVSSSVIDGVLAATERTDEDELAKVIAKKRARYADETKLMQYLSRQGFSYDDIKAALRSD